MSLAPQGGKHVLSKNINSSIQVVSTDTNRYLSWNVAIMGFMSKVTSD